MLNHILTQVLHFTQKKLLLMFLSHLLKYSLGAYLLNFAFELSLNLIHLHMLFNFSSFTISLLNLTLI